MFDDEDILINVATTANDIDEWDSLAQIRLILQMKNIFPYTLMLPKLKAENVGQMAELISQRQASD